MRGEPFQDLNPSDQQKLPAYLIRLLFERETYTFFGGRPSTADLSSFEFPIQAYTRWEDIPSGIRSDLFGRYRLIHPMYHRMRRGWAKVLVVEDKGELIAYGWIQDWRLFRRRFGWLKSDATCLGPYWTKPSHRGRGIYGGLLKKSVEIANPDLPLVIYIIGPNRASRRGIERAGFTNMGEFQLTIFLQLFVRHRAIKDG